MRLPSILSLALILIAASGQGLSPREKARPRAKPPDALSAESKKCVSCHARKTPGIVGEWRGSRHAREGVGCFECPGASAKEAGAFVHEGETIATVLTPNACSGCHGEIVAENQRSHHADAAKFIGSLDNVLGEIVEGRLAAVNGCWQCHGSTVAFLKNADGSIRKDAVGAPMLDPATWPNSGIGRVNLDGSRGACSACNSRTRAWAKYFSLSTLPATGCEPS